MESNCPGIAIIAALGIGGKRATATIPPLPHDPRSSDRFRGVHGPRGETPSIRGFWSSVRAWLFKSLTPNPSRDVVFLPILQALGLDSPSRPGWPQRIMGSSDQVVESRLEQTAAADHEPTSPPPFERERWNRPKSNPFRLLASFFSFFLSGMNDAVYGVGSCLPGPTCWICNT